ncbi:MAG: response regulator [Rhodospirillales bacterium]|jgi:guanidinopropionase|nr:response regulator [Rhodospirillales bacterium]
MESTPKRVLICDDDPMILALLKVQLESLSCELVGECVNGGDAIKLYATAKPDLTLMDISMPDVSGIEAIVEILKIDSAAKVVMISALNDTVVAEACMQKGATGYIQKGLGPEAMRAALARHLETTIEIKQDSSESVSSEGVYDIEKAEQQVSQWYWHGIATYFRCKWDADPENCDIALVGVPHSSGNGSTERDQHLAPRAVRNVSGAYRRAHMKYGYRPWDEVRINDLGDVPLPHAMVNDICVQHMETYFKRLDAANTRPVSIGGDHAITGPILKAIAGADATITGGAKAALLHFDAHTDDYDHLPHWLGSERSAGHWAAYLVSENHVDPHKSIQIGMRGNRPKPKPLDKISPRGYRIITNDEFDEIGVERTIEAIRERVGDAPLYITFDLDVLDPADAQAVSNLEAGYAGMRVYDAIKIFHGLQGMNVIGADIVCMIPTKDSPNNITAMNSMVLMFELIGLVTEAIRKK